MPSQNSAKNQGDTFIQSNNIPETSSIRGIRYLTCQGGGMKGIGDVGAVEGLEACGVLAQLEEVAGSSAGGLLATLLAIGCTAKEIRQEMLMIDFRAFQDKREPGWVESTGLKHVFKAGGDALDSVSEKISAIRQLPGVSGVMNERQIEIGKSALKKAGGVFSIAEKVEDVVGLALGTELGIWEGEALSYWLSNIVARKTGNPNITFKELAKLADAKGGQFKKLTLTGSNITDGILEYYNATNTPDMPITLAARISASFPGAYKPVIMIDELGNKKVKVDGGLLENLPDVFNKPPYISAEDLNKDGGNPRALALVFKDFRKQGPKKIENGIDLAKALYSSKMSEAPLFKKYGANIVYIDTVGMDTLEFDAPTKKREALAHSGKVGVHNAFKAILEQEKQQKRVNYHTMSVEELVRRKFALMTMAEELGEEPEIASQQIKIEKAISEQDITQEELQELINKAEERYLKRKKQMDPKELSDDELSEVCKNKLSELVIVKKQLEEKLRQLKLAKNALQFNRDQIIARFKENRFNNAFHQELHELKRMEENINENRRKKAKAGAKNNVGVDKEYEALKAEKEAFLNGIIKKYKSRNDKLMFNFFNDVLEDSNNLDFVVPNSVRDLWEYCSEDVGSCIDYINQTREEVSQLKEELNSFKQYEKSFSERTERSKKYENLLHFKSELDKTLYQKTSLLAKLDNFLIKKAPRLEKFIAPFLQAVAYLSFVCWLPLAIPSVGLAKTVSHFSSDPETRASADNLVNFFSITDIDFNKKLRGLRETTVTVIRKMSDNYISSDVSEVTYLGVLHKCYLEKSGITLENIFSRNPNETLQQYQKRLENEKMKLDTPINGKKSDKIEKSPTQRASSKPLLTEKRADKNFEGFREVVLKDVAELTDKAIEHLEKEGDKYGPKAKKEFIKKQQIMSIHLEYLQEINRKLKNDQELTEEKVHHYLESTNELGKDLPASFKKRYARSIGKFDGKSEVELRYRNPEQLQETEQTKVALKMFLKVRKAKHDGKTKGKLETPSLPSRSRLKKPKPKGFLPEQKT